MLSKEILQGQAVLKELSDEQITAIVTLSQNDENTVIAKKTGKIAQDIEADILSSTGIAKKEGERYFEYLKRAGLELKAKADKVGDTTELDKLKKEKEVLEKQIKDGTGDAALKLKLEQVEKELTDEKGRVKTLQSNIDQSKKEYETNLKKEQDQYATLQVRHEFDKALQGKKPAAGISENLYKETIDTRINKLLETVTPEWDTGTNGEKILRFRNKEGNVMNNPDNLQNPYTAQELLLKNVGDILDGGKKQTGTGTGGNPPTGTGTSSISIGQAKTKVQATEAIRSDLMAQGISTAHKEYQTKFDEAWKTNEVEKLPLR